MPPKRRKRPSVPEHQMTLIKAEAAYPRRWQGIRSRRPFAAQVKGTMFEPKPVDTQMDLFEIGSQTSVDSRQTPMYLSDI